MTTTNPSVLRALADRCEREEPSWMLTCEIEAAITPGAEIQRSGTGPAFLRIWGVREWRPLPYTASLDAAVTLVPETFAWNVGEEPNPRSPRFSFSADMITRDGSIEIEERFATTPALALCAASLRARAALAEGDA